MKKIHMTALIAFLGILAMGCDNSNSIISETDTGNTPDGFVYVNGGTFWMGAQSADKSKQNYDVDAVSDQAPIHEVTVSSFYMAEHEVTQAQYNTVMEKNPSYFSGENKPVEDITWYDAVKYCNALSQKEGLTPAYTINGNDVSWNRDADGYRLPTEAEWEFAARGGNNSKGYLYSGSNSVETVAWYRDISNLETQNVGTKLANELDLYDMSGNVWEWCWDWFENYKTESQTDPQGPGDGSNRIFRGGSWSNGAIYLKSTNRHFDIPEFSDNHLGFRLAMSEINF